MQTPRQNVPSVLQIYPLTLTHLSLPPTTAEQYWACYWCICAESFQKRLIFLLLLLLPLNRADERFKVPPSVSYFSMSELGVISLLITSQNPSFTPRIQSLSDYNEKIMIDRIKDRIWDWLVRNETGGEKRAGEVRGDGNRGRDRKFEKEREKGDRDVDVQ